MSSLTLVYRGLLASVAALAVAIAIANAGTAHAACDPAGTSYELLPPDTLHFDRGVEASKDATIRVRQVSAPGVTSCSIVAKSSMTGVTLVGLGATTGTEVHISSIGFAERTITFAVRVAASAPAALGEIEIRVMSDDIDISKGIVIGEVPVSIESTVTVAYKNLSAEPGGDDIVPPVSFKLPPVSLHIEAPDPYVLDPIEVPCLSSAAEPKSNLRCGAFAFWTTGPTVWPEGERSVGVMIGSDIVLTAWYYSCGRLSCPGGGGPPTMLVKAIDLTNGSQMSGVTGATMKVEHTAPGPGPFPPTSITTSHVVCLRDGIDPPCASGTANVAGTVTPDSPVRGLRFDRWRIDGADVAGPGIPLAQKFAIAFYKPEPAGPTELTCQIKSLTAGRFVLLTWVDNSGDETEFHVERRVAGVGAFVPISPPAPAGLSSYQDGPIPDGICYEYRVVAHRHADDAYSAYSNVAKCCDSGPSTCPPIVCPGLNTRVPASVMAAALADPRIVGGYCELANPGRPFHPIYNTRRTYLTMQRSGAYHPLYNSLVFKTGCQ